VHGLRADACIYSSNTHMLSQSLAINSSRNSNIHEDNDDNKNMSCYV